MRYVARVQPPLDPAIFALAECLNTHMPLAPYEERVLRPSFAVWLGTVREHPAFTVVQGLRCTKASVASTVAEVSTTTEELSQTSKAAVDRAREVRGEDEAPLQHDDEREGPVTVGAGDLGAELLHAGGDGLR